MTFTVNSLSRCSGGGHYEISVSVGARTKVIPMARDDMELEFTAMEEVIEAIKNRVRSAVKEANASTWNQARAAIEGKSFKL